MRASIIKEQFIQGCWGSLGKTESKREVEHFIQSENHANRSVRSLENRNHLPLMWNRSEYMCGPSGINRTSIVVQNKSPDPPSIHTANPDFSKSPNKCSGQRQCCSCSALYAATLQNAGWRHFGHSARVSNGSSRLPSTSSAACEAGGAGSVRLPTKSRNHFFEGINP